MTLRKVCLFNHSNCSHPSLEVVVYLFLSLKWSLQSPILWSVMCRFHSLYHFSTSLSFIAIRHSLFSSLIAIVPLLSLVVIRCHSLSFVVTRCHYLSIIAILCHSLSLIVPLVVPLVVTQYTIRLSFYKWSSLHTNLKRETRPIFSFKNRITQILMQKVVTVSQFTRSD